MEKSDVGLVENMTKSSKGGAVAQPPPFLLTRLTRLTCTLVNDHGPDADGPAHTHQ